MPEREDYLRMLDEGISYTQSGEHKLAIVSLQEVSTYFDSTEPSSLSAIEAALFLGTSYHALGDYSVAQEHLYKAMQLAEKQRSDGEEDAFYLIVSLYYLGRVTYASQDIPTALSYLKKGLELAATRKEEDEQCKVYCARIGLQLGRLLRATGYSDRRAHTYLAGAFALFGSEDVRVHEIFPLLDATFATLGNPTEQDFKRIESHLVSACAFFVEKDDKRNLALATQLHGLVLLAKQPSQPEQAEAKLKQALKLYKVIGHAAEQAVLYLGLSLSAYKNKQTKAVQEYLVLFDKNKDALYGKEGEPCLFLIDMLLQNEKEFAAMVEAHRNQGNTHITQILHASDLKQSIPQRAEIVIDTPQDLFCLAKMLSTNLQLQKLELSYGLSYRKADEGDIELRPENADEAVNEFVANLNASPLLKNLVLRFFSQQSLAAFAHNLKRNKTLQHLTIHALPHPEKEASGILAVLSALQSHPLRSLKLQVKLSSTAGDPSTTVLALGKLLETNKSLHELELESSGLSSKESAAIGTVLARYPLLRLVFRRPGNEIILLEHLAQARANVAELVVECDSKNSNQEKVKIISQATQLIEKNTSLRTLVISLELKKAKTDDPEILTAVKKLIQALQQNKKITQLSLGSRLGLTKASELAHLFDEIEALVERNKKIALKKVTMPASKDKSDVSSESPKASEGGGTLADSWHPLFETEKKPAYAKQKTSDEHEHGKKNSKSSKNYHG